MTGFRSPTADPGRSPRRAGLALGAALVAMALVAGLIFTFSVAVMPNLTDADDRTFVATMQRYNQNPAFPLTFTAALVLAAVAAVLVRRHEPEAATRWTVAALVLYGLVVAVTAAIHIPLNDELDRAGDPARVADPAHVRRQFEATWVRWNLVRTVLSTAALAALARALFLHGCRAPDRAPIGAAVAHDDDHAPYRSLPHGHRAGR